MVGHRFNPDKMKQIENFKTLFLLFIGFIANPNTVKYPSINIHQKLINVVFYYLPISFLIGVILLWYPVAIAEKLGIFNPLIDSSGERAIFTTILSAIVIAPLIEEGIFRLSLGYYRDEKYFGILYYASSVLFGLVHIFTYKFDSTHHLYIPFITMTQIFSGFMFGYIRMVYGFWYGVLLHSVYNIFGVIWLYFIGFSI